MNNHMINKLIDPSGKLSCEVGKDNVTSIKQTDISQGAATMFRITYKNGDYIFYGLTEYEVE